MKSESKWIILSYILSILLAGWVLGNIFDMAVTALRWKNPVLLQVMPTTRFAALILTTLAGLAYFRRPKVRSFSNEVVAEMKKVTWPNKQSAYTATIAVVIGTVIVAGILGVFDWICNLVITSLLQV